MTVVRAEDVAPQPWPNGGGTTRELARAGMRVLVLDASYAGGGTTAAGMGHLVVMDDSPAQLALTALSMDLWREVAPSLAASAELDTCGTIWVAGATVTCVSGEVAEVALSSAVLAVGGGGHPGGLALAQHHPEPPPRRRPAPRPPAPERAARDRRPRRHPPGAPRGRRRPPPLRRHLHAARA